MVFSSTRRSKAKPTGRQFLGQRLTFLLAQSLTTGSRQRPGALLLFAYTFAVR